MTPQQKWNKANPEKMAKIAAKWREQNPEKIREQNEQRSEYKKAWNRLKRYGLSATAFLALLHRQKHKCAGCQKPLTSSNSHVDHDHKTGKVRGILCPTCNSALGLVYENAATLYQLAAYLELPKDRPVVYLVGSLRNPKIVEYGNMVRHAGFEVVDNWTAASPIADDSWQEYSNARGHSYKEALESREAQHVFHFDKAYLNLADAVILIYPAGKSGHLEFGYATGQGKQGYIFMDQEPDRYDVMLQFANSPLFFSFDNLIEQLKKDFHL